MEIKWYNIGVEPSTAYPSGFGGIDYCPDADLPFLLWRYARKGREAEGAGCIAEDLLSNFQRHIERANASWFIPFLERMAKGKTVDLEEIQAKHVELFGKPLEEV